MVRKRDSRPALSSAFDDPQGHRRDPLAGAAPVVEGRRGGDTRRGVLAMTADWARAAFTAGLRGISGGTVRLQRVGADDQFGDGSGLSAALIVNNDRFFRRALTDADIGIGESYMDGDWTTTDLVALGRLMLRNRAIVETRAGIRSAVSRLAAAAARRLRDNSIAGSRRHIRRHYDLGNEFFKLFLDSDLLM